MEIVYMKIILINIKTGMMDDKGNLISLKDNVSKHYIITIK